LGLILPWVACCFDVLYSNVKAACSLVEKVTDEICQLAVELYSEEVPVVVDLIPALNASAELTLEWNIAMGLPHDTAFAIIETMHKYALNKGN
jgi:hypothetical protein